MKKIKGLSWFNPKEIWEVPHLELIAEIRWINKNIVEPDYSQSQTNKMRKYQLLLEKEYRKRSEKRWN